MTNSNFELGIPASDLRRVASSFQMRFASDYEDSEATDERVESLARNGNECEPTAIRYKRTRPALRWASIRSIRRLPVGLNKFHFMP